MKVKKIKGKVLNRVSQSTAEVTEEQTVADMLPAKLETMVRTRKFRWHWTQAKKVGKAEYLRTEDEVHAFQVLGYTLE